ncbi:MAG: hypothetical protein P8Y37_06970 [Anaerolineales bacterium]
MVKRITITTFIILLVFLSGVSCSNRISSDNQALNSDSQAGKARANPTVTDAGRDSSPDGPSQSDPGSSANTPISDSRLKPEDWRDWPVIPTLSPAMIEIYQQGKALGNREDAFSKVGDCQIIPDVFLGQFDNPTFILPEDMSDLQGTLDRFRGSFGREGYALKGGFVFPTVFSPLRADSSVCDPGETPFECELRVNKPSFVLISMEFRYDGRTVETHERYLRQAVEYALSRGIIPIVATKADNFEGDHSLNLTTAKIAYEYDIPLWNYWRAVQHLPNHGIDWDRDSYGFHVTPAAWWERSETFLRVLDSLTKDIQNSTTKDQTSSATETPPPDDEASPEAAIIPSGQDTAAVDLVEDWGKSRLVFDIKRRAFGDSNYLGIFSIDLITYEIEQISAAGSRLLGVSPDYRYLLTSSDTSLFTMQLSDKATQVISDNLFSVSSAAAAWDLSSNDVYYLASTGQGSKLYRYQLSSGTQESLAENDPVAILYADNGIIVWGEGTCSAFGDCKIEFLHWMDSAGVEFARKAVGDMILLPCQTDQDFVYAVRDENEGLSFHIQSLDTSKERVFWSLNTEYADCAWAPDNNDIAVTLIDRGWYSGELYGYHFQLLHTDDNSVSDMSFLKDLTDQLSWSPDGRYIASTGTVDNDQIYEIDLTILDLENMKATTINQLKDFQSENFTAIDQLYWLP